MKRSRRPFAYYDLSNDRGIDDSDARDGALSFDQENSISTITLKTT